MHQACFAISPAVISETAETGPLFTVLPAQLGAASGMSGADAERFVLRELAVPQSADGVISVHRDGFMSNLHHLSISARSRGVSWGSGEVTALLGRIDNIGDS